MPEGPAAPPARVGTTTTPAGNHNEEDDEEEDVSRSSPLTADQSARVAGGETKDRVYKVYLPKVVYPFIRWH